MSSYSEDQSEDEQVDWEEVDVDEIGGANLENAEGSNQNVALEIVLSRAGEQGSIKKRSANSALERQIRHQVHRMHTITLLTAGLLRNRLLNDALLKVGTQSSVVISSSRLLSFDATGTSSVIGPPPSSQRLQHFHPRDTPPRSGSVSIIRLSLKRLDLVVVAIIPGQ